MSQRERVEKTVAGRSLRPTFVCLCRRETNAALEKISQSDALTGLHNRHYLQSNEDILGMGAAPIKEQDAYTAIVLLDIQLDADNSVIQLQTVRMHKDQFVPDRTSTNIGGKRD